MADSNLFETTVGKRQLLLKTTVEQETKLFDEMYRSRKKQDDVVVNRTGSAFVFATHVFTVGDGAKAYLTVVKSLSISIYGAFCPHACEKSPYHSEEITVLAPEDAMTPDDVHGLRYNGV